ncbi:DUF1269 domain-containing protein [Nakamurella sp.]|uniref:DUF1269 domain-containing protein n=1 Tax=Nakamurella sp. TaxID=1869182 RepID=UPI003783AD48
MSNTTIPAGKRHAIADSRSTSVATLSVWIFGTADAAALALRSCESAQRQGRLRISDSAVVQWPPDHGRPSGYQCGTADGSAELSGAFWGLVFGAVLLAPLAGLSGPIWPPDGLDRIGLPGPLLEKLQLLIRPGVSALFVLSDADLARIRLAAMRADRAGRPPHCVAARLSREQSRLLRRAFGTGERIEADADATGTGGEAELKSLPLH